MEGNGWIFHGLRDAYAIFELGNQDQKFQHSRGERQPVWVDSVKIVSGSPEREDLRISSFRLWWTDASQPAFPPSWLGPGPPIPAPLSRCPRRPAAPFPFPRRAPADARRRLGPNHPHAPRRRLRRRRRRRRRARGGGAAGRRPGRRRRRGRARLLRRPRGAVGLLRADPRDRPALQGAACVSRGGGGAGVLVAASCSPPAVRICAQCAAWYPHINYIILSAAAH